MPKPYLNDLRYKEKPVISAFEGINTGLSPLLIGSTQAESMKNIDTRAYPTLKTREKRANFSSVSGTVHHMGTVAGIYLSVAVGGKWKYYDGVWKDIYTVEETDGDSVVFRGKTIYVNGSTSGGYFFENGTKKRLDKMPVSHYITTNANRLYAANKDKSYLYVSEYGDVGVNQWDTGEGSGVFEISTPDGETCSGLMTYSGRVMFFKPHSIHELYGTGPMNYQMIQLSGDIGCVSHRSVTEINGKLYWLSDGTVRAYNGGTLPVDISMPVKRYMDNTGDVSKACAGTDGERYYLSLPQKEGHILLTYDTRTDVWCVEDNINIVQFTRLNNKLYGITNDGLIKTMTGGNLENIDWHWYSKWFSSGQPSMKQNWHRIYVTVEILSPVLEGSNFGVVVINNKGQSTEKAFGNIKIVDKPVTEVVQIDLPNTFTFNADWLQVQLSGTGGCKVHNIEMQARTKGGSY